MRRLTQVRDSLAKLTTQTSNYNPRQNERVVEELQHQLNVLGNLPVYPGFERTKRASFELCMEIDRLAYKVGRQIGNSHINRILYIVRAIVELVKPALAVRKALPPGLG